MRAGIPKGSQVFTPVSLAMAMVSAVQQCRPESWLEPAMGQGIFLQAIKSHKVDSSCVTGIELDSYLKQSTPGYGSKFIGIEALGWMSSCESKFDAIVGNPPYSSLSDVSPQLQKAACSVLDPLGNKIRLSSNTWAAFVMASLSVLNNGGAISFVLPASWDYADYARILRHELPLLFETFHVYRSERPLFSDVADGSVVILATGFKRPHKYTARVECIDLDGVCAALADFHPSSRKIVTAPPSEPIESTGPVLSDFISLRLGGVTGDSDYFMMTERRRREIGLPTCALRKIVSKSRHLRWPEIGKEEWEELRNDGQRVWLFRPTEKSALLPRVSEYLKLARVAGGCNRSSFKVSNREPWYRTPLPSQVNAFLSGMAGDGPKMTFCCLSGLTATNTLYVVSFARDLDIGRRRNIALQLLGDGVLSQLERAQRRYASGLKKFEPGDILRLRVKFPERRVSQREYESAYKRSARI